jgi:hypothetical protein
MMAHEWNDPADYERDPDIEVSGSPYNPYNAPREQIMSDALESLEQAWADVRSALSARRNDTDWPEAERSEFARLMFHGDRFLKDLNHASHAI